MSLPTQLRPRSGETHQSGHSEPSAAAGLRSDRPQQVRTLHRAIARAINFLAPRALMHALTVARRTAAHADDDGRDRHFDRRGEARHAAAARARAGRVVRWGRGRARVGFYSPR